MPIGRYFLLHVAMTRVRCVARRSISADWSPPTHRKRWMNSDGRETITFQQRSDHRVLMYMYNRLITLFTKDSVQLAVPVHQTKIHR